MDLERKGWAIVKAATGHGYLGRVVSQMESAGMLYAEIEDARLYVSSIKVDERTHALNVERSIAPVEFLLDCTSLRTRVEAIIWFEGDEKSNDVADLLKASKLFEDQIKLQRSGLVLADPKKVLRG